MIKIEELEHLATLARIKLSEDDKKVLIKEFDSILAYVDQLKKANIPVNEEGRVGAVRNITRGDVPLDSAFSDKLETSQDKPHPLAENRDLLLAEAPNRVGDFIAVKKIIEQ